MFRSPRKKVHNFLCSEVQEKKQNYSFCCVQKVANNCVCSKEEIFFVMWRSVGNWAAYSSWRLGCKGARADKSPVTAFSCTSLPGILLMSKLCKDVRLLMAAGTGPCNPMFDKFLPHPKLFFSKNIPPPAAAAAANNPFWNLSSHSPMKDFWNFSMVSPVCVERDRERERESCLQSNNREIIQVTSHQTPISLTRTSSRHPWSGYISIPCS